MQRTSHGPNGGSPLISVLGRLEEGVMRDANCSSIKFRDRARLFEPPVCDVSTRVDSYDKVLVDLGSGSN
jgi:hypothetical protein